MKAVMLEVPPGLLEERRRLGTDVFDEMWEGVLHMNPPPSGDHQRLGADLLVALAPAAAATGLQPWYEVGFYNHPEDYRAPDLAFARPDQRVPLGLSGALLVVEIRSPGDETYDKLDWYLARGVQEILVVDPKSRDIELFRPVDGRLVLVEPDMHGTVGLRSLGNVRVATVKTDDGARLQVTTEHGEPAEI